MKKEENKALLPSNFIQEIREIILTARTNAVRSVDFCRVQMYWQMGKRIFEEEQGGQERADYGSYLIRSLEKEILPEYGSGFSYRQLYYSVNFYRTYPIVNTLCAQLNWSQYKLLISIEDEDRREYYLHSTVNNCWTFREMERQVNSMLYERLTLSTDKESVLAIARKERIPERPEEIIKEPMTLEFLGLQPQSSYYESDLENSIIANLQMFLLEMGDGFSFVARQKRLLLEDDEFFIDLVLYNRFLRCFVIIETKTHKLTHQDLGQLQMYVNYYDRYIKLPEEHSTIGILLCTQKNDTVVKVSLPENSNLHATEYQLYLPKAEVIQQKVEEWTEEFAKQNSKEVAL